LAILGLGSIGLGIYMLVASDWGLSADPVRASWFLGGIVTIAVGALGFGALLLGWHFYAQREVVAQDGQLLVRRWLSALLGRRRELYAITPQATLEFFVPGIGAKLRIKSPDWSSTFSIQFWSEADARALANWAEAAGAAVAWKLPIPR
jgi:hypothetical protein